MSGHQQAAVLAGAEVLWKADPTCFGAPAPKTSTEWADETTGYTEDSRAVLTAAAPHLRAAWEQPIRELHRPVEIEPSDTVCRECSFQLPNGHFFGKVVDRPCPTIALLEGGA